MIAAISLIRKRADLSSAQFRKHWLDPHGVMTAELPRLRRYWQSHCLDSEATNTLARKLGIHGFPSLWFDSYDDRAIAYTSPRIAACNIASEQFIGAVKRLVTRPTEVIRLHAAARPAKAVVLLTGESKPGWRDTIRSRVLALPGLAAYIEHDILEQAGAPNSAIPELVVPVAGIAEVTFETERALHESVGSLAGSDRDTDRTAIYHVEDYRLV